MDFGFENIIVFAMNMNKLVLANLVGGGDVRDRGSKLRRELLQ